MKMLLKSCGILTLLLLIAVQDAFAQTRTTPKLSLTYEQSSTTVGGSIGNDKLTVTDGGDHPASIRSRFNYRYTIVTSGGDEITNTSEVDGKESVVDPNTGSSVQYRYGIVKIGNKAGSFSVKVTAQPTDEYVSLYNSASTTFAVTVNTVNPTLSVRMGDKVLVNGSKDAQITLYSFQDWKNQGWHEGGRTFKFNSMPLPTVSLTHEYRGETVDDGKYYDVTYKFADGDKFTTDGKTMTAVDGATEDVNGTLTITATPKDEADGIVDHAVKTFSVKVGLRKIADETKIKTYIRWDHGRELTHYRMTTNLNKDGVSEPITAYQSLVPTIVDEYGNDVTPYFDLQFGMYDDYGNFLYYGKPMDVIHTYSDDPLDGYPGWDYTKEANTTKVAIQKRRDNNGFENVVLTTDQNQKAPDDYLITVVATPKQFGGISYDNLYQTPQYESAEKEAKKEKTTTVHGMLYGHEKAGSGSNVYEIQPNQYIYHCLKRAPKIVFDRNPQSVIPTDFEINPGNRFKPKGVMVDNTLDSHPTDSLIYNGNNGFSYFIFVPDELAWTAADGENPKDANGNPVVKVEICDDGYGNPAGASNTAKDSEFYWGKEAHQYVYDLDDDGNVIKNADGTPKGEIKTGKRYFTKQNWNNDDLRIKFHGTGRFPMTYTIVPWNAQWWDLGSSQTFLFNIEKSVPTHFVITPETIVTAKGEVSAAPKVRIVDDAGNDVTKYFDITPAKANKDDGYNLGDGKNGIAKYAINPWAVSADGFKINVNATLNAEGKQQRYGLPEQGTYTIIVRDATSGNIAEYEIMYDSNLYSASTGLSDKSAESDMGKFYFIKDGDFYPGTIVQDEIPGLDIQIGTPTETKAGIVYNVNKDMSLLLDHTVIPDGSDIPTTGFIRVMPLTNGYLSIDALFHSGDHMWILRDINTNEAQQLTDNNEKAQKTYPMPLIAGHTYALWSDRMSGSIYGLNFDPQFISLATDHEGWHDATTFENGYTGTLPKLAEREEPTVSYYLRDVTSKSSTSIEDLGKASSDGYGSGYHARVNTTTGRVTALALTADNSLTTDHGAEVADRVTIVGSVLGKKRPDGTQVEKRPHYNLYIGAMPTYVVEDGANFDMGNRISTNNIPTRIWMTFGGWVHMNDEKYPYRKKYSNDLELSDGWKTAMIDPVGLDEMTIDGFKFGTFGQENPIDENIMSWNSFRVAKPWNREGAEKGTLETLDGQRNGFMAPVRGTYLKFEPEESGKLFLYVLQNGMTDISKDDANGRWDKDGAQYLRRRALYFIDETGNNVEIPDGNEGWSKSYDKYLTGGESVETRFKGYTIPNSNYYCDGIVRAGWADGSAHKESSADGYKAFQIDQSMDGKYSWAKSYDHTDKGLTKKGQANLDADVKLVTNWWKNNYNKYDAFGARTTPWSGHEKLGGPNEVLRLSDGGFVLPTKGYVRYVFNVRAGKTYYVFMAGSKLGFCGFGFLPAGYTRHYTKWVNAADGIDNPKLASNAGFTKEVYDKLPKPTETEVFAASNTSKGESNDIGTSGGSSSTTTGNIGGTAITLDANLTADKADSYKSQLAKIFTTNDKVHQFVDVNLKRKFMKRHWSGICLPFSVSENQVKRVFGDHTSVITLDSVRYGSGPDSKEYRTLHFTRHVIQSIEAGRPYFIYPDGNAISDTTGTGDNVVFTYKDGDQTVNGLQFHAVTFENVEPMNLICYNEDAYNNGSDIFTYRVAGLYDCGDIPFYSYYMRLGANDKSQNNLSRVVPANDNVKTLPQLTGFNTYLYPHSSDVKGQDELDLTKTTSTNAKAASFWVTGGEVSGGEVTGINELIDELNTEATSFVRGVYTIDGRMVRSDNSLKGLPAGVYIMNGSKYIVR